MQYLTVDIDNLVATVTLQRPPVNALDATLFREIRDTFRALGQGKEASVVIFTAPGDRVFCAGVDLADSARRQARQLAEGDTIADMLDTGIVPRECFDAVMDCALPVIAAVNGAAVGAGLVLVACCDIIIASENARFSVPEIKAGVLGGGRHLQRLVGTHMARKMYFTGNFVSAQEFQRLGAVDAVVAPADLMKTARALADDIASNSPIGLRLAKEALNRVEDLPLKEGYRVEQSYTSLVSRFNDSAEARSARQEKRDPKWSWS